MTPTRFPFAFSAEYRLAGLPFGITPRTALVEVHDGELFVRFGLWRVRTTLRNVVDAEVTGPYRLITTIGPARLSFADRGLTMATNHDRGVCIRFAQAVPGIEPTGRLRHPALTLTVRNCAGLAAALTP